MKKLIPTLLALATGLLFVGLAPAAHSTERTSSLATAVHGKGKPSAGKPNHGSGHHGSGHHSNVGTHHHYKPHHGGWKGWSKKHYSHRYHRLVYWSPADGCWYYCTDNGYVAIDDMTDEYSND